jgi:hypothetical protein
MFGRNAEIQTLVRKKATYCMLHRQALVSRNMSEELQTVFHAVIRIVNCVKMSPLKGRLFGKLRDDMEAEHTAPLHHCDTRSVFRAKAFHRVFEVKEEIAIFLSDCNNNYTRNVFYDDVIQELVNLVEIF